MAVVITFLTKLDDRGVQATQRRLARLGSEAKGFSGSMSADMVRAGAALGAVGDRAMSVGKSLTLGVTLPAAAAGVVVWKFGAEFDGSMRQLGAAANASGEEMSQLTRLAKEVGYTTIFSAQDAAQAMLELAKSGITPAQIKAGALQATLDLAAAGELELGSAAETTSNTLNMFGLSAEQAGQVANALAGGANASSASVDSLRQALAQVGPGARNSGLSLQETTAVLSAFANKGIQGSDAGTSLKTMLTRLIPSTDAAAKKMKQLGLDFTDAKGRILPITQVAEQLKTKLGGLSQEQRNAALQTIFGSDATRAATVLMQEGGKGIREYIKATSDRTAASKMAAAQTESDAGQTKKAIAAMKTAAIDIQRVMAPIVADVANLVGRIAKGFGELSPGTQKLIVGGVAIAASMGPAITVFGAFAKTAGGALRIAGNVGLAFTKGAEVAPMYARALAAPARAITNFADGFRNANAAQSAFTGAAGTLGGKVRAAVGALNGGAKAAALWAVNIGRSTARMVANTAATLAAKGAQLAIAGASKAWAAAQWLLNAAMSANPIGLIVLAIAGLVAVFVVLWKKCDWFREFWIGVWNRIKSVAESVWPVIKAVGEKIVGALQWAWDKVSAAVSWFWDWAGPYIKAAVGYWWIHIKVTAAKIISVAREIWDKISAALSAFWEWAGPYIKKGIEIWKTQISVTFEAIKIIAKTAWDVISTVVRTAIDVITRVVHGIQKVVAFVRGVWDSVRDVTRSIWNAVVSFVSGVGSRILGGLRTVAAVVGYVRDVFGNARQAAIDKLRALIDWVGGVGSKIKSAIGNLGSLLYSVGQDIVRGLLRGITEAWHWVTEKLNSLIDGLSGAAKKLLGIKSPSRVFAEIGRGVGEGLAKGLTDSEKKVVAAAKKVVQAAIAKAKETRQAISDRAGEIAGGAGLWTALQPDQEATKESLLASMQANRDLMAGWVTNIASLRASGIVPAALLQQITGEGLGSAGQVSALVSMSPDELKAWAATWQDIQRLAKGEAAAELTSSAKGGAVKSVVIEDGAVKVTVNVGGEKATGTGSDVEAAVTQAVNQAFRELVKELKKK